MGGKARKPPIRVGQIWEPEKLKKLFEFARTLWPTDRDIPACCAHLVMLGLGLASDYSTAKTLAAIALEELWIRDQPARARPRRTPTTRKRQLKLRSN